MNNAKLLVDTNIVSCAMKNDTRGYLIKYNENPCLLIGYR